jgi:hypothetical protein
MRKDCSKALAMHLHAVGAKQENTCGPCDLFALAFGDCELISLFIASWLRSAAVLAF